MQKPEVVERLNIDGSHKYWELVDPETGGVLWREFTVTGADLSVYGRSIADRGMAITLDGTLRANAFEKPRFAIIGECASAEVKAAIEEALSSNYKTIPGGIFAIDLKPSPSMQEIVALQEGLMRDMFNSNDFRERNKAIKEKLASLEDFEYPKLKEVPKLEETRKTYGEPPWKFNKPFNHKSQNYVKSNNRNRTARKR